MEELWNILLLGTGISNMFVSTLWSCVEDIPQFHIKLLCGLASWKSLQPIAQTFYVYNNNDSL